MSSFFFAFFPSSFPVLSRAFMIVESCVNTATRSPTSTPEPCCWHPDCAPQPTTSIFPCISLIVVNTLPGRASCCRSGCLFPFSSLLFSSLLFLYSPSSRLYARLDVRPTVILLTLTLTHFLLFRFPCRSASTPAAARSLSVAEASRLAAQGSSPFEPDPIFGDGADPTPAPVATAPARRSSRGGDRNGPSDGDVPNFLRRLRRGGSRKR